MVKSSLIIFLLWSSTKPETLLISSSDFQQKKVYVYQELGNLFRPYISFLQESGKTIESAREAKTPELFNLTACYRVLTVNSSQSLFEMHIRTCETYLEQACSFLVGFLKNCHDENDVSNFILQALKCYGHGLAQDRVNLSLDYLRYKNKKEADFMSEGVYANDDALTYYEKIKSYDAILIGAWRRRDIAITIESLVLLLKLFPEAKNNEIDKLLLLFPKLVCYFEDSEFFADPEELALTDGTNFLCEFGRVVQDCDKSKKLLGDSFFILGDGYKKSDESFVHNLMNQSQRYQLFFPENIKEHIKVEQERSNEIRRIMKVLYSVGREMRRARNKVYNVELKKLRESLIKKDKFVFKKFQNTCDFLSKDTKKKSKGKRHVCPSAAAEKEGQQLVERNENSRKELREKNTNFNQPQVFDNLISEVAPKQKIKHQQLKIRINNDAKDIFSFLIGLAEFVDDENLIPTETKNIDIIIALLNGDYLNCNVRSDLVPALEKIGVSVDSRTVSSHWKLSFITDNNKKHTGTLWMPHGPAKESEVLISKGFGYALMSSTIDFLKRCGFVVINGQLFRLQAPST
jgi:hypothetical protein